MCRRSSVKYLNLDSVKLQLLPRLLGVVKLKAVKCGGISTFFSLAVGVKQVPCLSNKHPPAAASYRLSCHFSHLSLYLASISLDQRPCCSPLFQFIVRFGPFSPLFQPV